MKSCLLLLCLGAFACAAILPLEPAMDPLGTAVAPTMPPGNLAMELQDLYSLIQFKQLDQLFVRYLINDAQFQAFVRIINSNAGVMARWRWHSQPELHTLPGQWFRQRLLLSGGKLKMKHLQEMEMCFTPTNRYNYWASSVAGWQGFLNELEMYIPLHAIQAQIDAHLQQSAEFVQFWQQFGTLKLAYERWLTLPFTQDIVTQLQAAGIDTVQLDSRIRQLFGWPATVTATNSTTAVPPVPPQVV
ncbi:uncharacterized protein LOC108599475 isoform X1 [Drosophila busckii]|uniref:uncharacterized protein LOC108599475 isoform X1 n=1 Tax=Drosophila busckii TaxID=30019 RepID=UPI001432CC31|nr:uncharacterized protein LOC108599475 isoform X1 [Drosophila busckii]